MLGWAILAAIVLRFLIPRWQKRPPNRAAATLFQARGVQPTGPGGTWTRQDHLRSVSLSGTIALGLAALTWLGAAVAQKTINGSTLNLVATGALFLGAFGFVLAVTVALVHLVKAAFARSVQPSTAPDDEADASARRDRQS